MDSTPNAWEVWPSTTSETVLILANGFEDRYYVAERVRQARQPWGEWHVIGKTDQGVEFIDAGRFKRIGDAVKHVEQLEADRWSSDMNKGHNAPQSNVG